MKFAEKIKNFFFAKKNIDNELFDELCDLLIEGDFGAAQAVKTVELLKEKCAGEKTASIQEKLAELLEDELKKAKKTPVMENNLTAVLLLGVNGTGKTTTAAKLGFYYQSRFNKKTVFAAADTFRAAAIDQIKIHGEKLGMRVVAHKQGGDPAAVVYDALEAAVSDNADFVIADTAGRMHTKSALIEELRKIDRVVEQKASDICYLKFLVLDATTGRNACSQAEIFHEAVNIDGVILTKYDSSAKGGVVFSIASELKLPVVFICTGEKYTDIEVFNPEKFTREFTGIE